MSRKRTLFFPTTSGRKPPMPASFGVPAAWVCDWKPTWGLTMSLRLMLITPSSSAEPCASSAGFALTAGMVTKVNAVATDVHKLLERDVVKAFHASNFITNMQLTGILHHLQMEVSRASVSFGYPLSCGGGSAVPHAFFCHPPEVVAPSSCSSICCISTHAHCTWNNEVAHGTDNRGSCK